MHAISLRTKSYFNMLKELVNYLNKGATILTPTRRLQLRLTQAINRHKALTQKTWETPRIYALDDWFKMLWEEIEIQGHVDAHLLNTAQIITQWELMIEQSSIGKRLLQPKAIAQSALKAYGLLQEWRIDDLVNLPTENIDQKSFCEWAQNYQVWLKDENAIDSWSLPAHLTPFMQSLVGIAEILPASTLILYAFEELTPLKEHFFNQLKLSAWEIKDFSATFIEPQIIERHAYLNQQQEWQAAASWAKNLAFQGKKEIAIVVPNLTSIRHQIEILMQDVFNSLEVILPYKEMSEFFNVSVGDALTQYPIVQHALLWLKLGKGISFEEYSTLIHSPFFEQPDFESLQAHFQFLKTQSIKKITLSYLISILESQTQNIQWYPLLLSYQKHLENYPVKNSFSNWSQIFSDILQLSNWPGIRILNSVEYQTVQRLQQVLSEMSSLDKIMQKVTYFEAFERLSFFVESVDFQPQDVGASVQVMGLLEAAGQQFNHLWILGFHSEVWPPEIQTHPFIDARLQRQYHMPHSSVERELAYTRQVTARFKKSAHEIIFSHPLSENDRQFQVSDLINEIPLTFQQKKAQPSFRLETQFQTEITTQTQDFVSYFNAENIRLTSQTLVLQSLCPFRAFAELRLKLPEPFDENPWLSPRMQGSLIHRILEVFWKKIKTQAQLVSLPRLALSNLLEELINLQSISLAKIQGITPYLEIEKKRLYKLLHAYLEVEKKRPPFKVIAIEYPCEYELNGLTFKLRFDRIDEDINGNIILIDYKTGQFNLNDVWGERPKAPQLALYYLASQRFNISAIAVIRLNAQECQFQGISAYPLEIEGLSVIDKISELKWIDLLNYWQTHLGKLAFNFKIGNAQVLPLEKEVTCQFCHLSSVCRVHEPS